MKKEQTIEEQKQTEEFERRLEKLNKEELCLISNLVFAIRDIDIYCEEVNGLVPTEGIKDLENMILKIGTQNKKPANPTE